MYQLDRTWPVETNPLPSFVNAHSLTVDRQGNVYITEWFFHRIFKTDSTGQPILHWGTLGDGLGQVSHPAGVSTSVDGKVYVLESGNNRVQVFDGIGVPLFQFGSAGSGDGQFSLPFDILVGLDGKVYVVDQGNDRVQVFTADGQFLRKWGSSGIGDGQFDAPTGIAMDDDGNIYVADRELDRVQKFDIEGNFLAKWGATGTGNGQMDYPTGVAILPNGLVCVADSGNSRVQLFDANGVYQYQFGSVGPGDGQFSTLDAIDVGPDGLIYALESENSRVQVFNANGSYLRQWGRFGNPPGHFAAPAAVTVSPDGTMYAVDRYLHRIQKFAPDGSFDSYLGSPNGAGGGDGEFNWPESIAMNAAGDVYVTDTSNNRVQKFDASGNFLLKWGVTGAGDGEFVWPNAVAIGPDGSVYVCDYGNNRVQRFDANGIFISKWGSGGSGNGQFTDIHGVAVTSDGTVFVADAGNNRIQKFTSTGAYLGQTQSPGSGDGQFNAPYDVKIGADGNLYVADTGNHRIQIVDTNFTYLNQIGNGFQGGDNFLSPFGVSPGPAGSVYVADTDQRRVQKFVPVESSTITSVSKAVVVMGGGSYPGNGLLPATVASGALAFWAMTQQGINPAEIYVLGPSLGAQLNFTVDADVDAIATKSALADALTQWAMEPVNGLPVKDVYVYLVDHGGVGKFRLNADDEILDETELAGWLNTLQPAITGDLVVIYDACESGTFLATLNGSNGAGERVLITSTASGEPAHFVQGGQISFSSIFWPEILNGQSIGDAFTRASAAMGWANQQSLLEADGNGSPNESTDIAVANGLILGKGTTQYFDNAQIGSVAPDSQIAGVNDGLIWVDDVTDNDGIQRVWAVITPPSYVSAYSTMAVIDRASLDLVHVGGDRYEATYGEFVVPGTYAVDIFVEDGVGVIAGPVHTTVDVGTPPRRKAIVIAGGDPGGELWPAHDWASSWVYSALKIQAYTDDDIYFLTHADVADAPGKDGVPGMASIQAAIGTWGIQNTRDLTIVLVGPGGLGQFLPNATEVLSWDTLDGWLDSAQANIPGVVTVIADCDGSGSLLPKMSAPVAKVRYCVAASGAGQQAAFGNGGVMSFTRFFWVATALGANLGESFNVAAEAMAFAANQRSEIDDTLDGYFDLKSDGFQALHYTIGTEIGLAGDEPLIGAVVGEQILGENDSEATIWVDQVSTLLALHQVVGLITPPGGAEPVEILLQPDGTGRYSATYNGFVNFGTYPVTVTAVDLRGVSSAPAETIVAKPNPLGVDPDIYEQDNSFGEAKPITVDGFPDQRHNFHVQADEDWVSFYATLGDVVTIETNNLGFACDTIIELYGTNGTSLINSQDDRSLGDKSSRLVWTVTATGVYFVRVRDTEDAHGDGATYDLRVWRETGPEKDVNVTLNFVSTAQGGAAVPNVTMSFIHQGNDLQKTISNYSVQFGGNYNFSWYSGTYRVEASAPGFSPVTYNPIVANAGGSINLAIQMTPVPGSIQTTILPAGAVSAGAKWHTGDNILQNSGATVSNLAPGNYSVVFTPVAGWIKPATQNVQVSSSATTQVTGTYVQAGSVSVTIQPAEAMAAGAQWRLDGGPMQASGATLTDVTPGSHTITFSTVAGWITPADIQATVTGGQTNDETGTYVARTGSLNVTLLPTAAVTAGGQWQVDGGAWHNSGDTVNGLSIVGQRTVSFKSISGWAKPGDKSVQIVEGQTANESGTYTVETGSLKVTIEPDEAVNAGAKWRVDNGALNASGATVTGLSVDEHILSFVQVDGWVTPAPQNVDITANTLTTKTGTYQKATLTTPSGLQASDGTFTDKIRLTWNPVQSATGYKIFRATTWNGGEAAQLGTSTNAFFEDFSAAPPSNTGGGGCKSAPAALKVDYVKYVYWVQATGPGGIQGDWSAPDDGYRGAAKNFTNELIDPVYESALPPVSLGPNLRAARPDDVLAVRIRADGVIDPTSIVTQVTSNGIPIANGEWMPYESGGGSDGWVISRPEGAWPVGQDILFEVTAATESGEALESITYTFRIVENPSLEGIPPMAGSVGDVIEVRPSGTVGEPSGIIIANPKAAGQATVYCYLADGDHPGWYRGDRVDGWLARDPVVTEDGSVHISVRHGAVICMGPDNVEEMPASAGLGHGDLLVIMSTFAVLAILQRQIPRLRKR
ncbi:MAG: hypothetical protein AMXMBFR84_42010 [Candidatus Hydrogenedentota bacterium]